jgi:hypothetical protein
MESLRRFGIIGVIYTSDKYLRIRLNEEDAEKFFLLVAPYIPPSMQYKLPERYRGGHGWIPSGTMQYKPMLTMQIVDAVEDQYKSSSESCRYDIETETHNFFANGILVHNSNCRVGIVDGECMAGSHRTRRKLPAKADQDYHGVGTYWFPWSIPWVRKFLEDKAPDYSQLIIYGEVFGPGIQDLTYGRKGLDFRAFDIIADGHYLPCESFFWTCRCWSMRPVPLLYEGPYSFSVIKNLAVQLSTEGNSLHMSEGVVVKPALERTDPRIGRVVLKYVSDNYLLRGKEETTDA